MNAKDLKVKKSTETDSGKPEVPEDFICIDPKQKRMVLEFLDNFNQRPTDQVLVHLKLCLYCREIAANKKPELLFEPNPLSYSCWSIIPSTNHVV